MGIPKYQQIKNDLLEELESGTFEGGDRFYSESELTKKYEVSSITVIRAVKELVEDGYLVRFQGKGTFVSRARKRKQVEFSDVELFGEKTEQVKVLKMIKGESKKIKEKLHLDKDESYYKIIRVRKVDSIPFIIHFSYIPSKFIKEDKKDISHYESIYTRFKEDFNIHMHDEDFVETNSVCFPTESKIAELLEMDAKEPTVYQEKTTTLNDGVVAEYTVSYKKWDYFKIEFATFS